MVAPEWVAAYEPDGDRAPQPLTGSRTRTRMMMVVVVVAIFDVEFRDVFVHRDRWLGGWWTRRVLLRGNDRRDGTGTTTLNCWRYGRHGNDTIRDSR